MSDVVDRFIKYCKVASQSDPLNSKEVPSTSSQFEIANLIAQDLRELGAADVTVSAHAYVTAHWPASAGCEDLPCIGLCGHIDTAWQAKGDPVRPHIVRYEGGKLIAGVVDGREVSTSPDEVPSLEHMRGWDIICTDGSSLLGGDDKAGDAEIISLLYRFKNHPELQHPRLALAFVPDEEIGHGAKLLDLKSWGARWGYTLDGGPMGEYSYECFNAAEAKVRASGLSVHTGTAKGVMINASEAIMRFHQLLPPQDRPEFTDGYDGFYYLERMEGNCEQAMADYIIRDHDASKFASRKQLMQDAVAYVNEQFGTSVLEITITDQYRNLADVMRDGNMHLVDNAVEAYKECGFSPQRIPMRGGTDGAQLSYRGLACPNLSAGYYNAHGPKEFVPIPELEGMVNVLERLMAIYAQPQEAPTQNAKG